MRALATLLFLSMAALIGVAAYFILSPVNAICDPTGDYVFISNRGSNHQVLYESFWMRIEKEYFSFVSVEIHDDSSSARGTILNDGRQLRFDGYIPWVDQNAIGTLYGMRGKPCEYIDWDDGTRWHRGKI
jgi:hypothetical protein